MFTAGSLSLWNFLKDETCEKAQAFQKKLYLQFRRSGTEAVLIAYKLNVPEYLRVVGKPAHLIVSLYEHPSISERLRTASGKDYPGGTKLHSFVPGRSCCSDSLSFHFCTFLSR